MIGKITELLGPDVRGEIERKRKKELVHELFGDEIPLGHSNLYGYIGEIEMVCCSYLEDKQTFLAEPKRGAINNGLWELRKTAESLMSLIENPAANEGLGELYCEIPISSRKSLSQEISNLLFLLGDIQKPKRGRQTNSGNWVSFHLGWSLYDICQKTGNTPSRINGSGSCSGVLHKLLDILRDSLDIGRGEFSGKLGTVIDLKKNANQENQSRHIPDTPEWAQRK